MQQKDQYSLVCLVSRCKAKADLLTFKYDFLVL